MSPVNNVIFCVVGLFAIVALGLYIGDHVTTFNLFGLKGAVVH